MADEIINGLIATGIEQAVSRAVAAERERCAQIAEKTLGMSPWQIAAAIRRRKQEGGEVNEDQS